MSPLSNVRFVLVETSHPGNIGAVARAMKNMGLTQLFLVAPKIFPAADATARASGADDLLVTAKVCATLADAVADCQWVIGATARRRAIAWPRLTARECAEDLMPDLLLGRQVAVVFGREYAGLTNDEMACCNFLMKIPCNPAFSSLNLAAAAQVVAYELFVAAERQWHEQHLQLATFGEMESFYQHLFCTLQNLDFMTPARTNSLQRRIRRIYNRAHLEKRELDILRGILTAIRDKFRLQPPDSA